MADAAATAVPFFKKSKSRPSTARRRDASPSVIHSEEQPTSEVALPQRRQRTNLLTAGTKRSFVERDNKQDSFTVNWSSGSASHTQTAQEIIEGDQAEELLNKRAKLDPVEDVPDDGKYHGAANYKKHLKKSEDTPKAMRVGPQRSNASTIRTVTIVDYQPDVCKDYKETGYCGFGDTCKFLHDRGTYLAGWQLDKLAENPLPNNNQNEESDSDSDEEIPFACFICRNPYTDPVVTRCGHYFCSSCAIKRFSKTPKCAACGAPTGGIFNRAEKVIEKVNQKRTLTNDDNDAEQEKRDLELEIEGQGSDDDSEGDSESK